MVRAGASPRKFCPRHESGARTTETVTEPYLGRPPTLRADSSGAIRRRTDLQASLMHVHTGIARRTMILSLFGLSQAIGMVMGQTGDYCVIDFNILM